MSVNSPELEIARQAIDYAATVDFAVDEAIDSDPIGWIIGRDLSSLRYEDYFNHDFERAVQSLPLHPANPHGFPIPELNGQPISLDWSQAGPLREALRRDETGHFVYSTVVWSAIKKSAKSTLAGAVGLWFMFRKPYAMGKIIANDIKQAASRVFYYQDRAISLHPVWHDLVKVNLYKMRFPNGSVNEAIPIDPTGEAGGNDDFVCYSELWGWKHEKAKQMWTETTLSPLKYGQSMRWGETYAGFRGESPVLEQLHQQGVEEGAPITDLDPEMYHNRSARLFVLWRKTKYLRWQTEEYYAQEASTLTPSEFDRVHGNLWSASLQKFVPDEWWDACQGDIAALDEQQSCVIAADAGVSNDSFGLVMVSHKDGIVEVRYVQEWIPPKDGQIDFDEPEAEIKRLFEEYPVIEVAYDEYQLANMAQRLTRQGIPMRKFSQAGERAIADKNLHDMIRDRRIQHGGQPNLKRHIQNASKKEEGDGQRLRLVKRSDKAKIDLAVCASMAADRMNALYGTGYSFVEF